MKLNKKQIIALKRVVDYLITSEREEFEEYVKAHPKLITDDHIYTQAKLLEVISKSYDDPDHPLNKHDEGQYYNIPNIPPPPKKINLFKKIKEFVTKRVTAPVWGVACGATTICLLFVCIMFYLQLEENKYLKDVRKTQQARIHSLEYMVLVDWTEIYERLEKEIEK